MSEYHMDGHEGKAEDALERLAREGARRMLAAALEQEVAEFLGRGRYERGEGKRAGYRNGYHRPREVAVGLGRVQIRAPRVRDTEEPFESQIIQRYERASSSVKQLIPSLYLHGLATGDFEPALRGLLGESAPLSPSSVVRLKAQWEQEYTAWKERPLAARYAYVWVDGLYLKAGLGEEKAALLVVIGVNEEGQKETLTMMEGYRESADSWGEVLRDMKQRGVQQIGLATGDGNLGFWAALHDVFPSTSEQRCWFHKMANVLDKMPKNKQPEAKTMLRDIYQAPTRGEAQLRMDRFADRFSERYPRAVECLRTDQEALLAFYAFPKEHWKSLRTTNPIESVFSSVRLRTNATRRMRTAQTALYLVYQLVRYAGKRWRRIDGAELVKKVLDGAKFVDGIEVTQAKENAA